MGNPSTYTPDLAEFVINRLWEGRTIPEIERENPIIKRRTLADWRAAHPEFAKQYKAAMEGGAYAAVDETREIVDNLQEPADSRKLRAWQRFEEAKRKAPHIFGDKVQIGGDPENPIVHAIERRIIRPKGNGDTAD